MRRSKGSKQAFTLIEVLIVVVIIGVLAALVIPRMLGSPEKAKLAEAYQMIGALTRAQQARMDTSGLTTPVNFTCPMVPNPCTPPSSLGMGNIIQKHFWYLCDNNGEFYCQAYRSAAGSPNIVFYYTGSNAGLWFCRNGYVCVDTGVEGYSDKGCKPNW